MLNNYAVLLTGDEKELAIQTHNQLLMSELELPNVIRILQLQITNRNAELIRTHSELSFIQTVHLTINVAK